jgi:transcriptional regulator GlxA family with amidase domain
MTPQRYAMQVRVDRARELLLYSDSSILEVPTGLQLATWYKRIHVASPSGARGRPRPPRRAEPQP